MRAYKVVDVFTAKPMLGNPLAVILDCEGIATEEMQAIARWTNLSETTFLLPPTHPNADYRVRIFTPRSELPFAGHPTLGTAHAALESGRVTPRAGLLHQECGVGLVPIAVTGERSERELTFELPPAKLTTLSSEDCSELEAVLGAAILRDPAPAIVNVGAIWIVAQLPSADAVLKLKPVFARSILLERRLGVTGISVFGKHDNEDAQIEVRSFAPSCAVEEDPVCGSGNGSIAIFQSQRGLLPTQGTKYLASQGRCVGRRGQVAVEVTASGAVKIGGKCVTCVEGTLAY